jgi:hypothetical protein
MLLLLISVAPLCGRTDFYEERGNRGTDLNNQVGVDDLARHRLPTLPRRGHLLRRLHDPVELDGAATFLSPGRERKA